ncbi:DUF3488 and transglutaminase-like domain-containing protein [Chitinibacter sp. ZOR0017]|uniref:transglutaminase TgpA family protein n=1 Tax=Chitinibacter sp. ZOR0017 TaxID=1339254 RepID=UPI000689C88E|nr:DUF3488 and transglutaminase-like domain-containing protein [Chitinibacter sp. ZOR0017]
MAKAHTLLTLQQQQWLSITLAICSLPHLAQQPPWLAACLTLVLLVFSSLSPDWRSRIPRWSTWLLAGVVATLVWQAHNTLVGREGGVAVLLALAIVKLLETRTRRDARALLLLMFLLTGVAFLHGQEPWQAAYALLASVAIIACAQHIENQILPLGNNLKASGRILLEGIPIAILLFVLFPRLPSPLWAVPDSQQARTGLSGEAMTPGNIANLIQDDSIAFRVSFQGPAPDSAALYWRGPVFDDFDGEQWKPAYAETAPQAAIRFTQVPQISGEGPAIQYTITLEPNQQPWLLALDMPVQIPAGTALSNRLQLINPTPITERKRYTATSLLRWQTRHDTDEQIMRSLTLPVAGNPQARALASRWASLPPAARVQAGLQWLQTQGYRYTLSPPLLQSRDRVDEFLFQSKLGFCEHYASAFAFLMRAAQVPARVVTGYQGGKANGDYWIVRQAEAHAWVEVWLAEQGWQRVDPTFVVAPSRINEGLANAVNTAELPFMLRNDNAWLRLARLRLDVLVNHWNQWVVGFDQQKQQDLLKKLGIEDFLSLSFLAWLFGGLLLTLGGFAGWLLYKHRPARLDAPSRALRQLERKLQLPREPSETVSDYLARASRQRPSLARRLQQIGALYLACRYAEQAEKLGALRRAIAALPARSRR